MALKVSVYIATSLDGFIARQNGDIDWLTGGKSGQDYGYANFMSTIDYVVMGRNTYEKVLTFGGWGYDKKVIVLSSKKIKIKNELKDKVEVLNLAPQKLVKEIENEKGSIFIWMAE